ncbi:MAG: hypothetical protein GX236_11215 [Clostridiaceae bacterium]|nr:hypothetical protein [Clostridiaceae bacterium]
MENEKLIIEGIAPDNYNDFKITLDIDNFNFTQDAIGWHYEFSYDISGLLADFTKRTHGYARIYRMEEDSQFTSNSSTHGVFIANFISKELRYWADFTMRYSLDFRIKLLCKEEEGIDIKTIVYGDHFDGGEDCPYIHYYYYSRNGSSKYIAVLSDDNFYKTACNVKARLLTTDDVINFLCDKPINESEYTFIP